MYSRENFIKNICDVLNESEYVVSYESFDRDMGSYDAGNESFLSTSILLLCSYLAGYGVARYVKKNSDLDYNTVYFEHSRDKAVNLTKAEYNSQVKSVIKIVKSNKSKILEILKGNSLTNFLLENRIIELASDSDMKYRTSDAIPIVTSTLKENSLICKDGFLIIKGTDKQLNLNELPSKDYKISSNKLPKSFAHNIISVVTSISDLLNKQISNISIVDRIMVGDKDFLIDKKSSDDAIISIWLKPNKGDNSSHISKEDIISNNYDKYSDRKVDFTAVNNSMRMTQMQHNHTQHMAMMEAVDSSKLINEINSALENCLNKTAIDLVNEYGIETSAPFIKLTKIPSFESIATSGLDLSSVNIVEIDGTNISHNILQPISDRIMTIAHNAIKNIASKYEVADKLFRSLKLNDSVTLEFKPVRVNSFRDSMNAKQSKIEGLESYESSILNTFRSISDLVYTMKAGAENASINRTGDDRVFTLVSPGSTFKFDPIIDNGVLKAVVATVDKSKIDTSKEYIRDFLRSSLEYTVTQLREVGSKFNTINKDDIKFGIEATGDIFSAYVEFPVESMVGLESIVDLEKLDRKASSHVNYDNIIAGIESSISDSTASDYYKVMKRSYAQLRKIGVPVKIAESVVAKTYPVYGSISGLESVMGVESANSMNNIANSDKLHKTLSNINNKKDRESITEIFKFFGQKILNNQYDVKNGCESDVSYDSTNKQFEFSFNFKLKSALDMPVKLASILNGATTEALESVTYKYDNGSVSVVLPFNAGEFDERGLESCINLFKNQLNRNEYYSGIESISDIKIPSVKGFDVNPFENVESITNSAMLLAREYHNDSIENGLYKYGAESHEFGELIHNYKNTTREIAMGLVSSTIVLSTLGIEFDRTLLEYPDIFISRKK